MKIICSWCKKFMGEKEPFEDKSTTHGKCPDCIRKQEGDLYLRAQYEMEYTPDSAETDELKVVGKPRKKKRA